jgi:hypothetical protein
MKHWNRYNLYHPALNLPGTGQTDRLPPVLGEDSPLIDDRKMSDFLNYFAALAHQINYYDTQLNTSDWGPFFSGDLPFLMSQLAAADAATLQKPLAEYQRLFRRQPGVAGLQLLFLYTWYTLIYPLQNWASLLQGSGLALEQTIQTLIRGNLRTAIRDFIRWYNTAVRCFCISRIDLTPLLQNTSWDLTGDDLVADQPSFSCTGRSRRSQLLAVEAALATVAGIFVDAMETAGAGAADQVNQQFDQLLLTTGQGAIRPHLALLYALLKQYICLQNDLNSLMATQLSFTYQNILQLSPAALQPDQAYIIFSLQQQVASYALSANLSLKNGKDNKNADVFFQITDPLTITQAQATTFSTLFVDSRKVKDLSYVEGVYMAPDATKADGQTQPFDDPDTACWPTLGAKWSKYTPPGATRPQVYPTARLGFLLASPVLLMNEGTRQVKIRLECLWGRAAGTEPGQEIVGQFAGMMDYPWQIVTPELIAQAQVLGVSKEHAAALRRFYLEDTTCHTAICDEDKKPVYLPYALRQLSPELWADHYTEVRTQLALEHYESEIWNRLLVPQNLFTVVFSGPNNWIIPAGVSMQLTDKGAGQYVLTFDATLTAAQDPVTAYNPKALGETLGTTQPAVKITLNDAIKIPLDEYIKAAGEGQSGVARRGGGQRSDDGCGLERPANTCGAMVSAYTFFRNLLVHGPGTFIDITVCNVKTLAVQNDDNVLSATSPFTPFGVKPVVQDFDLEALGPLPANAHANLVGPDFYIGSAEVFLKKWTQVTVKMNWKGKPSHFWRHYWAYIRFPGGWRGKFPRYEVNFSVQHNNHFHRELHHHHPRGMVQPNLITKHNNRRLFAKPEHSVAGCDNSGYAHAFHLLPEFFDLEHRLRYDPNPTPMTGYKTVPNGYIRLTLENQDFLHKAYASVMAARVLEKAQHPFWHVPLPKEPWTPTISDLAIDYTALADHRDITMIQLYPYPGTYQVADISGRPSLLPVFRDEGNLFIGITGLVPGDGLSMLFQLAEATANTEEGAGKFAWQYLADNEWQDLQQGFGIVADKTNGLSTTGLVQYDFPDDISTGNTIMPSNGYWIKASMKQHAAAASQTIAILAQAGLASFVYNQQTNDPARPGNIPLPKGSISKLTTPDPKVNSISQPYASFGGSSPETYNNAFTVRVSEQLRHKGRAIQTWDYERLVLANFPQVLRAKCIAHSQSLSGQTYDYDFPVAPGNLIVAVLPDPGKVTVADAQQPTVPMSVLTAIQQFLQGIVSPFIHLSVCNPRYEPADICVDVTLTKGMSQDYCQTQLQQDISNFLMPWLQGGTATAQFGQSLYRSSLVQYISGLSYVANLNRLALGHPPPRGQRLPADGPDHIDPLTPRSILVPGRIAVRATGSTEATQKAKANP